MDAIKQYCDDRNPDPKDYPWNAPLFGFKKCIVHFAVDAETVMMCTNLMHIEGRNLWFLSFNKGHNDGAGNPPLDGRGGFQTDYLWNEILTKTELANIMQNFALYSKKDGKQIFPRRHQLQVVKSLLADVHNDGLGHKYSKRQWTAKMMKMYALKQTALQRKSLTQHLLQAMNCKKPLLNILICLKRI